MLSQGEGVGMNSWPREGGRGRRAWRGERGGWNAANATLCHNGFRRDISYNRPKRPIDVKLHQSTNVEIAQGKKFVAQIPNVPF